MNATHLNFNPTSLEGEYVPAKHHDAKKRPNLLIRIITKIWNAVKGFFKKIAKLFSKSEPKLSEVQKQMMRRTSEPTSKPRRVPRKPKVIHTSSGNNLLSSNEPKKSNRTQLPPIENPVMRDFHQASQQFMSHVLDCAFDEKIAPKLGNVSNGIESVGKGLKFGADLAIKVGDSAVKPLFEKLAAFEVEKTVRPELDRVLAWLLKGGLPENFKAKLQDKLGAEINESLLDPCINWLNSDRLNPLSNSYSEGQDTKTMDKVFQAAVSLLVEHKIEALIQQLREKIGDKLPQILKKCMIDNGMRISDILVRRMITILEHTPHEQMFKDITKLTLDHTEALISAENQTRELITTARASTSEEAKAYIAKVDAMGEEQWIKQEIVSQYSQYPDGKNTLCHPHVADLINNPGMDTAEKEENKEKIFDGIAERLIPLLLPKVHLRANGEDHEVDSLVYLLDQIELPPEFREMAKDGLDISKEILSPKMQETLKGLWDLASEKIEEIALAEAKKAIKKGVMIGLNKFFEQFITLNSLNELTGNNVLPSLREQIYISLAREEIAKHAKNFEPLFVQLSQMDDAEAKSEKLIQIAKAVETLIKARCVKSADCFESLSEERYLVFMVPEIESILQKVRENGNGKVILEKLQKVGKPEISGEPDPIMEKLIHNLLFGIGKLQFSGADESQGKLSRALGWLARSTGYAQSQAESTAVEEISRKMVSATKELRSSPNQIVKIATKQINKQYGTKEAVERQLFTTRVPVPETVTEAKLEREIKHTADLAYDTLDWKAKTVMNPSDLEKAIGNIYQKMLGNPLVTQNLLVRAQEVILTRLGEGAKVADEAAALNPIRVNHIPSIIPGLLTA